MKLNKMTVNTIFLMITYIILMKLNIIYFKVFPQALVLIQSNSTLCYLLKTKHPHTPRYIIELPSLIFSKLLDIDIHRVNTYYSIFLLVFSYNLLLKIYKKLRIMDNFTNFLTMLLLIIFALIINGRFIFSFFGEILLMYSIILKKRKYILALFFSMVSSGTMMVVVISMIIIGLRKKIYRYKKWMTIILLLLIPIGKYVLLMIKRNYIYFDKNILKIFSHGILDKIYFINIKLMFIVLILIISIVFLFLKNIYVKYFELREIVIIIGSSIFCGLFGKTTFMMGLLPTFILSIYLFFRIGRKLKC